MIIWITMEIRERHSIVGDKLYDKGGGAKQIWSRNGMGKGKWDEISWENKEIGEQIDKDK